MKLAGIEAKSIELIVPPLTSSVDDVVEIGILLPANRASALIQMAKSRHESVGHLLRKLIDRELAASRSAG